MWATTPQYKDVHLTKSTQRQWSAAVTAFVSVTSSALPLRRSLSRSVCLSGRNPGLCWPQSICSQYGSPCLETHLQACNSCCILGGNALRVAEAGWHRDHGPCTRSEGAHLELQTVKSSTQVHTLDCTGYRSNLAAQERQCLHASGGKYQQVRKLVAANVPAPEMLVFSFFSAFALSRDSTAALMASGCILVCRPPSATAAHAPKFIEAGSVCLPQSLRK